MAQDNDSSRRGIERELKRGSLELIVLHLLNGREAYGYEIVSELTSRTNGSLEVTDGTLYPVLYRRSGPAWWPCGGKRQCVAFPASTYRLTDEGRRELTTLRREWMSFARVMGELLGEGGGTDDNR